VLLHVVDCATLEPGRDPISDLEAIESELSQYSATLGDLLERPRLVALNKVDVPEARELAEFVGAELVARGYRVFPISAVAHDGLRELKFALAAMVEQDRAGKAVIEPARIILTPRPIDDSGFTVVPDPDEVGGFVVRGSKPERWVNQTQFDNDEAVGFLADRLAKLGVEEELSNQGAMPGATVTIGTYVFDFEPTAGMADEAYTPTRRGVDERLDPNDRPNADQRLASKKARRSRHEDEDSLAGNSAGVDDSG
jgi:GTP-binding protein